MSEIRYDVLPREFWISHRFVETLHDRLVEIIGALGPGGFAEIKMDFRNQEEEAEFEKLDGHTIEEVLPWLESHGYSSVIGDIMLKQFFPALLMDFCEFLSEAIQSSERGKTTVAFALLRKPLKDNLHYLEWLLADPSAILTSIYNDPPAKFALGSIQQRNQAVRVIAEVLNRIPGSLALDPEFIYELRYEKTVIHGFDHYWDRALHLVTVHKHLATAARNMNFIFDGDAARVGDWRRIYSALPMLLYYAVEICECLAVMVTGAVTPNYVEASLHRKVGLIVWGVESKRFDGTWARFRKRRDLGELGLICNCAHSLRSEWHLRQLFLTQRIICPRCGRKNNLGDFLIPDEGHVEEMVR